MSIIEYMNDLTGCEWEFSAIHKDSLFTHPFEEYVDNILNTLNENNISYIELSSLNGKIYVKIEDIQLHLISKKREEVLNKILN